MAEVVREGVAAREVDVVPTEVVAERPGLRWGAIVAGAVTALGICALLYDFGLAVGLSRINPTAARALRPAGLFAGVWALIVPLVALFVGGWVAGRGAGIVGRGGGAVHGLVMWSLTTIIAGAFIATALSVAFRDIALVGQAVARAGGEAVATLGGGEQGGGGVPFVGLDANQALQPVNDRLQAEGKPPVPAGTIDAATKQATQNALTQGRFDKQGLEQSIVAETGLSQADAAQVADRLEAQYQDRMSDLDTRAQSAAQNAKTGALRVAEKSSRAFWGIFGAMFLGLIAAVVGGAGGASMFPRRPLRERRVPPPLPVAPRREVYP